MTAALLVAALCLAAAALWGTGAFHRIGWWAMTQQHALQSALAGRIQDLRAGEPAALSGLIVLCAGYGFVHALGPGHGKVLITGAAAGSRASALRMAVIATLGSLAQAVLAIGLVYGALGLFRASARGAIAVTDAWLQPLGNLIIAGIGGWLLWRGLMALRHAARDGAGGSGSCGHAHGPDAERAARATSAGAALALIAGMAARPCTGALFVLVIAWRMDLQTAGIAAVLAMGLGTAAFTVLMALLAVTSRDAALFSAGPGRAARLLGPGLQVAAGCAILAVSGAMLSQALAS